MERLQNAIAKARLMRQGLEMDASDATVPTTPPLGGTFTAAPRRAVHSAGTDHLWNGLPMQKVSPRHMARNRLIGASSNVQSVRIDILRTRLLRQMDDNGWQRVMVTSPTAGCGKSTLVCNLAFSLLRQRDRRALILDFDFRRPGIAALLGIPEAERPGIGAVLSGAVDFKDAAYRLGDGAAVCAAKTGPESAPQLLGSADAGRILDEIQQRFGADLIVMDVPPLFANDDPISVAQLSDCAVLVAAAGQTSVDQIDRSEREIANYSRVAGVVANKVRFDHDTQERDFY